MGGHSCVRSHRKHRITVTEYAHGTLSWRATGQFVAGRRGQGHQKVVELGVNFYDTAQGYLSYPHVALGLKGVPEDKVVMPARAMPGLTNRCRRLSKSACRGAEPELYPISFTCTRSLRDNLRVRQGALDCLVKMKREGNNPGNRPLRHTPSPVSGH